MPHGFEVSVWMVVASAAVVAAADRRSHLEDLKEYDKKRKLLPYLYTVNV